MERAGNQSFEQLNSVLTEDVVKQRFVPFLKEFYRNRYEPVADSIQVTLDNVGTGSLVADIQMTFRKNDGSPFTCTCEATSRDKAGEVKFALNLVYFLWDCAAFGALCAVAAYVYFYATQFKWLFDLQPTGNLGFILGVAMIGFFIWYFTMQGWRKYRYIYAIEQFKRYQADEQWVAIAEDVFPSPNDPYMVELKFQCIYQGFGLAVVPAEGAVRILNAPSRIGIFGKNRKMVDWATRSQWYQMMSQNVSNVKNFRPPDSVQVYFSKILRPVQYLVIEPFKKYIWGVLSKPYGQTATVYSRFMSGQQIQKWIFVVSILAIIPLYYKVLTFTTENMADLEALKNWESDANPEDQPGYIPYDGQPTGVPKQYPIPIHAPEPEIATIDLSGSGDDAEEVPTINLSGSDEEPKETAKPAKTAVKPKQATNDACAGISGKKGWIIQDNAFSSKENATARVKALNAKGIAGQATPRSCFEAGGKGYIVWLGVVRSTESAARETATGLEKTLQRLGLRKGKLLLRSLK